jgi:hypothetical protein
MMYMFTMVSPFGSGLMDELLPHDLSSFLLVARLKVPDTESRRHMKVWRDVFMSREWIGIMAKDGYEVTITSKDLGKL